MSLFFITFEDKSLSIAFTAKSEACSSKVHFERYRNPIFVSMKFCVTENLSILR